MSYLTVMMVAALLVSGLGVAILGSIKVPLANRLGIDETRVGGLVSLFGFAMIPAMLVVGFFTDEVDKRIIFSSGLILMTLSLLILGCVRAYAAALAGVLLFSTGWSLLINVGNALVIPAFGGSEVFASNLGNVFFGMGAFLTPLLVTALIRGLAFPAALGLLACLPLAPVALAFLADFPALPATATAVSVTDLLTDPILWLCGFALFFYGPMEASLGAWSTTYLRDLGVKESTAAGLLSAFWLTYMAARLTTALVLKQGWERACILDMSLACVVVLSLMVWTRRPQVGMALVPLAGAAFGPVFPTLIAVLFAHFPPQAWGRAVGLLFAIGGVGWTTLPILIGNYAQRTNLQRAFGIVVAAAVGLSAIALVLLLMGQGQSP